MDLDVDRKADRHAAVTLHIALDELETLKNHSVGSMLLTQPPVRQICVEVTYEDPHFDRESIRESDGRLREPQQLARLYGIWAEGRRIQAAQISQQGGVRLGHVLGEIEKMEFAGKVEKIAIYLSGVVVVSEEDERVVEERTSEWRKMVAGLEGRSR
ncbi:hypothetical protein LTR37_012684 [Vermiconidia calcicola]|uniref:Uncharacterized protein n=1 Tax=Vermiconidia calcicola TaxID=1690605 RepID=A0ACC3MZV5_9PEZI|nr:hypothetical protein LTR37_012684 [Vermiconidia calcicola]